MDKTFTRAQARQNAAFLAALRRTGNARAAARDLGVHRSTYTKRRAKSAAFAQAWDAALVFAHAALSPPRAQLGEGDCAAQRRGGGAGRRPVAVPLRTTGGESHLARSPITGRLQLRRSPAGRMTKAAEQAFLSALSACANVRLAAAAAGFAHSSFYARARKSKAFAREFRLALAQGYERVELAALAAALPESWEDDAWRHNDPPPIPHMTADQALQLLWLHEKRVNQQHEQPHRRRRRGESDETHRARQMAMWAAEKRRESEDTALARAARWEEAGDWRHEDEAEALPPLPSLDQVTGWSKAKGGAKYNEERGMFGGWRLEDWEARKRERKRGEAGDLAARSAEQARKREETKDGSL